ncbi:MAG: NAD(+)/NADH kinase [Anaerolineales bacterium]|nr:NAD(+)/NADH kinase [Anaerolineales bacterium]
MAKPAKPTFKHAAVLSRAADGEPMEQARQVAAFLSGLGVQASPLYMHAAEAPERVAAGEFDLIIAVGGDGTMLRAGHLCAPAGIPLLGINEGSFGFLIELERATWREYLPRLLSGEYRLEPRMLIHVELWRAGQQIGAWEAVNEAMLGRGRLARPVHLAASLDGQPLTTYVADGLIIATATGSTAYALAAGGPVLPPELRNMVLVPVAAHLSMERAIVLAEGAVIRVEMVRGVEPVLTIDGQQPIEVRLGDWVELRASSYSLNFLRFRDPGDFYARLLHIMDNHPAASAAASEGQ